jgi:prevent-host-death family protein
MSSTELSIRELRNDVSEVVRRAEAGETFTVTVRGRPAAELGPLGRKPRSMPSATLEALLKDARADPDCATTSRNSPKSRPTTELSSSDPTITAVRLRTLNVAELLDPVPVDLRVADTWSELRASLRLIGRRLAPNDWMAATAIAHRMPLVTRDEDFAGIDGLETIILK